MRRHCKVTGKICYAKRYEAEIAADKMALRNWQKGEDTEMDVYPCAHCGGFLHVGTRAKRPLEPWLTPLHQYKYLPNPRPHVPTRTHAGNLTNLEKTHDPRRNPYHKSRPRRNRTRRPYPTAR